MDSQDPCGGSEGHGGARREACRPLSWGDADSAHAPVGHVGAPLQSVGMGAARLPVGGGGASLPSVGADAARLPVGGGGAPRVRTGAVCQPVGGGGAPAPRDGAGPRFGHGGSGGTSGSVDTAEAPSPPCRGALDGSRAPPPSSTDCAISTNVGSNVDGSSTGLPTSQPSSHGSGTSHASALGPEGDQGDRRRSVVPLPLVRKLRLHMDSCAGTNKSQFFFGGLGLVLSCGLLDCAMVLHMVVGHTKFGPDLVARMIAGKFNQSDVFNHGQLVNLMRPYTTAAAYDAEILQTWKQGTQPLFAAVDHIMSYRGFTLLADDGEVDMGEPATPKADFEPFADRGRLFDDAVLTRECTKAAARGLRAHVLPALRDSTYRGIGRAAVPACSDASLGSRLLPTSVSACRRVRLFTRRSSSDPYWREQEKWMPSHSVDRVNAALAAVEPYTKHPEMGKVAYGSKAKSLSEQYAKFVPRQFVPDKYAVSADGHSGLAAGIWKQTLLSGAAPAHVGDSGAPSTGIDTEDADVPASPSPVNMRWSAAAHKEVLVGIALGAPFNGVLPKSSKEWCELAAKMPVRAGQYWEVGTVKRHALALAKARADISTPM